MLKFLLPLALFLMPMSAKAELRLLMFESDSCYWCARWDDEIGGIYAITQEGRAAPLQRVDIFGEHPKNVEIKSRPAFTPTFILLQDGTEIYRMEGYPGPDFFWSLLEREMRNLPEYIAEKGAG